MTDPASALAAARAELARLPRLIEALVADLDPVIARTRPVPGEWAPVEILCHLRDEETEDFGARLRIVTGGGGDFAPIRPDRWPEERRYLEADAGEAAREIAARRRASLALLAALAPESLLRAAPLRGFGPLSGMDLLVAWVAHDRLHMSQLEATLARLWADRWAPLRADYAGPIPYPPAR